MTFLAIVHAPTLRAGARVCICDLDQTVERLPTSISSGAAVSLRFGACCPDLACGSISEYDAQADRAVLRIAESEVTIQRSRRGGVGCPGLIAEDWFVVDGLRR